MSELAQQGLLTFQQAALLIQTGECARRFRGEIEIAEDDLWQPGELPAVFTRLFLRLQEFLPLAERCQAEGQERIVSCNHCLRQVATGRCSIQQAQACGCSFFQSLQQVVDHGEDTFRYEGVKRTFTVQHDVDRKTVSTSVERVPIVWKQEPERTSPLAESVFRTRIISGGFSRRSGHVEPEEESFAQVAEVTRVESVQTKSVSKVSSVSRQHRLESFFPPQLSQLLAQEGIHTVGGLLDLGFQQTWTRFGQRSATTAHRLLALHGHRLI